MAYTTINKPSDYFNTKLYTGTGSSNAVTGVGFQPDLVWIKVRSEANNNELYDAVRGATKRFSSDLDTAEDTNTAGLTAFGADGFTVNTGTAVNGSSKTYVAWNWLADNTSGSSNTDGSITSTVSVNTTSGFSIVKYTGDGNQSSTVGHGLGTAPKFMFIKHLNDSLGWGTRAYHSSLSANQTLYLNGASAESAIDAYGGIGSVGANTFGFASISSNPSSNSVNSSSGINYIAYCFAEKKGFSKMGYYTGNGSTSSPPFIYTGFKPSFVMTKAINSAQHWIIQDNKRIGYNPRNNILLPSATSAEVTTSFDVDFLSNGFVPRTAENAHNLNTAVYVYVAFAEHPLVSSTGTPCTAR